jgi:energy-coupling factor transporter ATP-binding protein EcfA2
MTTALELAVSRKIGEFELDVAFTVPSGMAVLFGPSGAGKSLTLALIAGLVRPGTGTIVINGQVVTDCAHRTYVTTQEPSGQRSRGQARRRPHMARTGRRGGFCRPATGFALGRPAPAGGPGTRARRGAGTRLARRAAHGARLSRAP